jgi:hypothetical protein
MKKRVLFIPLICMFFLIVFTSVYSEGITKEDCFYLKSLHYTARGMEYWYSKENGGIETLTNIPYSNLSCGKCHYKSCDTCHKTSEKDKSFYSAKAATNQDTCLKCHARETFVMNINEKSNQQDVHFAKNMKCKDCHTARDIHGDGIEYNSMKQTGAIDAKCENCHKTLPQTTSHKIHGDKLDCKACHERQVATCYNCHMDIEIKEGKRVAIPVSGWLFLMNHEGKVTSANMQNFVVNGNKTFIVFAPQHSHSIMKEGRKCKDCHDTEVLKEIQKGTLKLTWLDEKGNLKNIKGVIPVVEGVKYEGVYFDYKNGEWIPINNPEKPLMQYAGYGKPLTKEQLNKMKLHMVK